MRCCSINRPTTPTRVASSVGSPPVPRCSPKWATAPIIPPVPTAAHDAQRAHSGPRRRPARRKANAACPSRSGVAVGDAAGLESQVLEHLHRFSVLPCGRRWPGRLPPPAPVITATLLANLLTRSGPRPSSGSSPPSRRSCPRWPRAHAHGRGDACRNTTRWCWRSPSCRACD